MVPFVFLPARTKVLLKMRFTRSFAATILSVVTLIGFAQAQTQHVAPTDALPAVEQQKAFHLPEGFEIQLVASEPDIGQPMNLNFDAAGRLWITSSIEYPYPCAGLYVEDRDPRFGKPSQHAPQDRVTVLSGIQPDGSPSKIDFYTNGLNIPIGITPVADGALIYDIPYIKKYTTNADSLAADNSTELYGPFGNVDTHGMTNSLIRWIDGWVYACHGFRNTTTIKGSQDGEPLKMNSGNTYRFREDGSHVEQFTWGQVNPFGLTFDEWGHLYSADCHSKPLTNLIPGAYYQSFGKAHDGLGFGPDMIDHSHGSTGICGPAYYAAAHFPDEFQGNLFLCNPVTGRVHRDRLNNHGATRFVESLDDFITCDDPWFRPVDAKVGPDGALYIADFYNSIIGHYEVPLEHPKRDRTHGRIWRVVYTGNGTDSPTPPDLTQKSLDELVNHLGNSNLTVRMLATNELLDRFGDEAMASLKERLTKHTSPEFQVHAAWCLFRLQQLDAALMRELLQSESPIVRTHLARILKETSTWVSQHAKLVHTLLDDSNSFVVRAAAEAMAAHPQHVEASAILTALKSCPEADTHLRHALRITLRNHLREADNLLQIMGQIDKESRPTMASVLLSIPTSNSATAMLNILQQEFAQSGTLTSFHDEIRFTAEHASEPVHKTLVTLLRKDSGDELAKEMTHLRYLQAAKPPIPEARAWAAEVIRRTLPKHQQRMWIEEARGNSHQPPVFPKSMRFSKPNEPPFWYSLPTGEAATGTLRSAIFPLPERLSFYVAGHCGFPNQPSHGKNRVVLKDAKTQLILASAEAPRNDIAQKVEWDLRQYSGKSGYLEIIDGDNNPRGYAWIAAGKFSIDALNPNMASELSDQMLSLAKSYRPMELVPELEEMIRDKSPTTGQRLLAAEVLFGLKRQPLTETLLNFANKPGMGEALQEQILSSLFVDADEQKQLFIAISKTMTADENSELATVLMRTGNTGLDLLLGLIEQGHINRQVLAGPQVEARFRFASDNFKQRYEKLVLNLPKVDQQVTHDLERRRQEFSAETIDLALGEKLFKNNCSACHKLGQIGNVIGPQLDGVGRRGPERLIQDMVDPNRNVDAAFRASNIVTNDGRIKTGLFRREENGNRVFVDNEGKEFAVAQADIEVERVAELSLMPVGLTSKMSSEEFNSLLAWILQQNE